MNIRGAINRGFNLLALSITGLAGLAFLPEIVLENDPPDKVDDVLLLVLAIIGAWWYSRSGNRYRRSIMPVVLVVVGLLVKATGVIIEHADPEALGDDIGGLILFVLATVLVIYQYRKTRALLESTQ